MDAAITPQVRPPTTMGTADRRADAQRLVLTCDRSGRTLEAVDPRRPAGLRHQRGDARPVERKAVADRRPVRAAPAPGGDHGEGAVGLEALQAREIGVALQSDLPGDSVIARRVGNPAMRPAAAAAARHHPRDQHGDHGCPSEDG
jgi:hypothetical protein